MKRQRISPPKVRGTLLAKTPVLTPSSQFNQILKPSPAAWMSYKELIKVVGVDCEMSPSYWRKAIDHSAETVVFFQVDLRGTVPRMAKSVRICGEEGTGENVGLRMVPSVYVGDTLLSSTYVQTIIGRRFLADEDDLMKLLEHAGILQEENVETTDNQEEGGVDGLGSESMENVPLSAEPSTKKVRSFQKSEVRKCEDRITRSGTKEQAASVETGSVGFRPPIDLSALLLCDKIKESSNIFEAQDDMELDADFDISGLPTCDDDDLPLGYDTRISSKNYEDDRSESSSTAAAKMEIRAEPDHERHRNHSKKQQSARSSSETSSSSGGDYPYQRKTGRKVELSKGTGVYIEQDDLKSLVSRAKSKANLSGNLTVFLLGGKAGLRKYFDSQKGADRTGIVYTHRNLVDAIAHFLGKLSDKQCPGKLPQSVGQTIGTHLSKVRKRLEESKRAAHDPENTVDNLLDK